MLLPGLIEALHQLLGLVQENDEPSNETSIIWEEKVEKSAHHWAVILNSCHESSADMDFLCKSVMLHILLVQCVLFFSIQ